MRLKYLYFISLILAFIAFTSSALSAQEDYEYTLSIKEYLENALPPQEGRLINYDEITGMLTVTDTPSNQRLIRRLVKQFDVGPRQVLIEAKFVEIEFSDLDELGIEWYWYRHGDVQFGDYATDEGVRDISVIENEPVDTSPTYQGVQWDSFPATEFGLGFVISHFGRLASDKFITAYLRALASEGRANLLSSPKVTTLSGQMANIQITQTIPYISNVEFENNGTAEHPIWQFDYTIEEKMTGITLEVTPYVSGGNDVITLDIHPEVSNLVTRRPIYVGDEGNPFTTEADVPALLGWPVIDIRTAETSVIVQSGESVVLGGFVKDDETLTKKKIPLLGDIPLLGNLFKYEYKSRTKKNLVIFLTATLVTAEGETATR